MSVDKTLADLVRSPDSRITSCVGIRRESEELAELRFTANFDSIEEGVLVLDPANYWCLRSIEYACQLKSRRIRFVVDEIEIRNGLPIPKKTTLDDTGKDSKGATSSMKLVSNYDLSIPWWLLSPSEFRLSAFGLNEPPGYFAPTNYVAWIAAIAVAALVFAGAIFLYRRRRSASARSSNAAPSSA